MRKYHFHYFVITVIGISSSILNFFLNSWLECDTKESERGQTTDTGYFGWASMYKSPIYTVYTMAFQSGEVRQNKFVLKDNLHYLAFLFSYMLLFVRCSIFSCVSCLKSHRGLSFFKFWRALSNIINRFTVDSAVFQAIVAYCLTKINWLPHVRGRTNCFTGWAGTAHLDVQPNNLRVYLSMSLFLYNMIWTLDVSGIFLNHYLLSYNRPLFK